MGFAALTELPPAIPDAEPASPPKPARIAAPRGVAPTAASPSAIAIASVPPVAAPVGTLSREERIAALAAIAERIAGCTACGLHLARTRTVPGEGSPLAELCFVGEGPGAEEDATGRPFVGKAGQLLTKIIEAMTFTREEVFIANVVKCRPPGNRVPEPGEMAACLPYLKEQLRIVAPRAIVALGATAVRGLLPETEGIGITKLRGKWLQYDGIPLMPTFHPAYLLRNPPAKKPVWEDMQEVMKLLGRTIPRK